MFDVDADTQITGYEPKSIWREAQIPSPAGYPQGCGVVGQCRSNCREGRVRRIKIRKMLFDPLTPALSLRERELFLS